MFHLPLERGWQYEHSGLVFENARVIETTQGVVSMIDRLREEVAQ